MKNCVCTLFIHLLFSYNSYAQSANMGSWNIVNLKYNHSNKISLFAESQLRSLSFYNQFHYYEYKGGLNYKMNNSLILSLGAGKYQTYLEGGNFKLPMMNNEFRLWPQISLLQEINKIKIEQRYRTEMRWTSSGYRNRYRYRLGISLPFGKKREGIDLFTASVYNELFFTDKQAYFERNRVQVSLNYKTGVNTSFLLGCVHQFDYKINDETGRNFLLMGFYYEVKRKNQTFHNGHIDFKDN